MSNNVTDEEILELMGVVSESIPTLSGVMVFSKYPQAYFPQLCIIAIVLPGTEIGDIGKDGERFIDNERITGSIPEMLEDAVDFVRRNCRTKIIIDENGFRRDVPEYPIIAVREAILNALVHRDYSIHTENIPIRIEMYRDHMEIKSSGGLYGKITENRYSGIPTIRKEFKKTHLPAPIFSIKHGEFKVVFKNNIYQENRKYS